MINKIKRLMLTSSVSLSLLTLALVSGIGMASAAAACNTIAGNVASGANGAIGGNSDVDCSLTNPGSTVNTISSQVVNIFSIVVGAAAVIMIIYAGFRYITSGGSSDRVGGAKNSLIYAIIGLVIVAIAQLIVHFVLSTSNTLGT